MWWSLRNFLSQMCYVPSIIKNQAQFFLHDVFPNFIPSVCRNGDFMCHASTGLMKLEQVLPTPLMEGLDVISEHPYKTAAVVVGGASLLTAFYCFRGKQKTSPKAEKEKRTIKKVTNK